MKDYLLTPEYSTIKLNLSTHPPPKISMSEMSLANVYSYLIFVGQFFIKQFFKPVLKYFTHSLPNTVGARNSEHMKYRMHSQL